MDVERREVCSLGELVVCVQGIVFERRGWSPSWFRGQADSTWALEPKVSREVRRLHKTDHGYETNLMHRFVGRAGIYGPGLANDDRAGWLQVMQHHGLPTRLLDWSRSPLVAAYFALEPAIQGRASAGAAPAVWMLAPHELNGRLTGQSITPSIQSGLCRSLVEGAFWGDDSARESRLMRERRWARDQGELLGKTAPDADSLTPPAVAVMASETDIRMMVQQGAFTIHSASCGPLNLNPVARDVLVQFVIPVACVGRVAAELEACGFAEGVIYPDLDHLSRELSRTQQDVGRPVDV